MSGDFSDLSKTIKRLEETSYKRPVLLIKESGKKKGKYSFSGKVKDFKDLNNLWIKKNAI